MDTGVKRAIVAVLALGSLAAAFFVKPLPQDPAYHHFADQRTLLGIPNFMDVASNLPFFGVGLAGVYNVLRRRDVYYPVPEARSRARPGCRRTCASGTTRRGPSRRGATPVSYTHLTLPTN